MCRSCNAVQEGTIEGKLNYYPDVMMLHFNYYNYEPREYTDNATEPLATSHLGPNAVFRTMRANLLATVYDEAHVMGTYQNNQLLRDQPYLGRLPPMDQNQFNHWRQQTGYDFHRMCLGDGSEPEPPKSYYSTLDIPYFLTPERFKSLAERPYASVQAVILYHGVLYTMDWNVDYQQGTTRHYTALVRDEIDCNLWRHYDDAVITEVDTQEALNMMGWHMDGSVRPELMQLEQPRSRA